MLYSHSNQEKAFDFFASFLRNVIAGDDRYISLVEPTISDAKSLASGEKDYYAINRDDFDVIVFLAEKDPDFMKQIDTHHLSVNDFERILSLIIGQRDLILA
jgi:hypothetical protein